MFTFVRFTAALACCPQDGSFRNRAPILFVAVIHAVACAHGAGQATQPLDTRTDAELRVILIPREGWQGAGVATTVRALSLE